LFTFEEPFYSLSTYTLTEYNEIGANAFGRPEDAPEDCVDRYEQCANWVSSGECDNNPGWMTVFCSLSCNACHMRDAKVRCARNSLAMDQSPVYAPGDMGRMFEGILEEFGEKYGARVMSRDPWVVVFDNFVTDSEANGIVRTVKKWERSTDTGSANKYGEVGRVVSQSRTSANAWCDKACEADPDVISATSKIEEITRVPSPNYESFQILQYEPGQFYRIHHDNGGDDSAMPAGPRILTFFLYLSDVAEGGETNFPSLNISVKPKRGRAVLWPSTLDGRPDITDRRTVHEAKPVIKGIKYAANAWLHLYNFKVPNLWGCTGSFDMI
jgi:prolyl 4-hydroxylase